MKHIFLLALSALSFGSMLNAAAAPLDREIAAAVARGYGTIIKLGDYEWTILLNPKYNKAAWIIKFSGEKIKIGTNPDESQSMYSAEELQGMHFVYNKEINKTLLVHAPGEVDDRLIGYLKAGFTDNTPMLEGDPFGLDGHKKD